MRFFNGISRAMLLLVAFVMVSAGAPVTSPYPVFRPGSGSSTAPAQTHPSTRAQEAGLGVVLQNIFRPKPRVITVPAEVALLGATARSPRPILRPRGFEAQVRVQAPAANSGSRRGSVCGIRQIKGSEISSIPAKLPGCGLANPVKVTSVSGIRLTQAAIMDCDTAKALNEWVRNGVIPAVGRRGGGLEGLKVVAHYACRTRNNQAGARISEHGKGHAVDIAGIYLKNGDLITVLNGWRNRRDGKILRAMHSSACGPFGTVLGPEANRFHQDHFHVDTARYRSGPYCR